MAKLKEFVKHTKANAGCSGLEGCKFLSECEHERGDDPKYTCDWSSQSQYSSPDEKVKTTRSIYDEKGGFIKKVESYRYERKTCSICGKKIDTNSSEYSCMALFENPKLKFI